jgi:hypothetical protein
MRALRYCNGGARAWFKRHGLDWERFVLHGLPEEELLATGCGMAVAVVERARQRVREEGAS